MKKAFIILMASICAGCRSMSTPAPSPDVVKIGGYLGECMAAFSDNGGKSIDRVDGAFVLWVKDTYEIIFKKKPLDTVSERWDRFPILFSCTVEANNPEKIIYMSQPVLAKPLISKPSVNSPADSDRHDAVDMLFLFNGKDFEFSKFLKNGRKEYMSEQSAIRQLSGQSPVAQ